MIYIQEYFETLNFLKSGSEPQLAYLKRWIILCDLHNNIIRHLIAFIFYCYQSVVDKTWMISRMPCCSKYDQSITINRYHTIERWLLHILLAQTLSFQKKFNTISTRYFSIFYSFRKKNYTVCSSLLTVFILQYKTEPRQLKFHVIKSNSRDTKFSASAGTSYNGLFFVFVKSRQNKHTILIKWH